MSTRDEAVRRIQRDLGFLPPAVLRDEIIDALKEAQRELEKSATLPWFLLSETGTATTGALEERLPHPPGFLREFEPGSLWRYDAAAVGDPWIELGKGDYDTLVAKYPIPGVPVAYASVGGYFMLKPTPDAQYIIKVKVYLRDAVLDVNIENKWLGNMDWLLVGRAGMKVARAQRNADALAGFKEMVEVGQAALLIDEIERETVNRKMVIGGED